MYSLFFFNDTATTEIYTLSLHDALPISHRLPAQPELLEPGPVPAGEEEDGVEVGGCGGVVGPPGDRGVEQPLRQADRKSTRLNTSHANISYAVFCLKKKT